MLRPGPRAALVGLLLCAAAPALRADDPPRRAGERLPSSSHTVQEVQGAARRSPLPGGAAVVDVTGVVTAVTSTSFTIQAPPDGDEGTSDALLVHVGRDFAAPPEVGDDVAVSGKVTEWAGKVNGQVVEGGLTQTQLERPTVRVLAKGAPLPAPVVVGQSGRMPPVRAIAAADLETWDPAAHALDFWETLEHMRVVVKDAVVVGPTARGELYVVPEGGAGYPDRTPRGGVLLANEAGQPCPSLLAVDNTPGARLPAVTVGDRIARLEGLLVPDAARPARLLVPSLEGLERGARPRQPTRLAGDDERLTIATFNVENFSAARPARADELARALVKLLRAPALVALQEVMDDDGPGAPGQPGHTDVVSAAATYAVLCSAVVAQGGPRYRWTDVPPAPHMDGGQPGGNIRVGFLWDPARVTFEPRGEPTSATGARVEAAPGGARLAVNPARVAPDDPAFGDTRRTLVAEFGFRGRRVVLLGSHLTSRREDDPTFGPRQPPALHSEARRLGQARAIQRFVRELAEADPSLTIVHVGDCNDFHFRPALKELAGDVLEILTLRLPPAERYSYVFQGTSQPLDHALLGGPLRGQAEGVELEYVHMNAEYPQSDRVSDHDPLVVRLRLP